MLGRPKYNYGDRVSFVSNGREVEGVVYIIDAYGNFSNDKDVSYDILVEDENTLYKHVMEKLLKRVKPSERKE